MKYKINWDGADGVFAVPDNIVESLKLANGKAIKVILYILKNKITDIDYNNIASAVGVTDEDVEDALSFWQQIGIIYADGNKPVEIIKEKVSVSVPEPLNSQHRSKEKATKMLSPAEIAEHVEKNENIRVIFDSAEVTLGRILTYTDQRTLIWLHEYYGFSPDILMMIMDFAANENKATIGFIEKIATSWHENGITTHELAQREIIQLKNFYSLAGQVTSKLGLNRTLTPTERKFVNQWAEKNIAIDLIILAYERTVDTIGKVKFSYMNTILLDWYDKGCATPKDVKLLEKKYQSTQKATKTNTEDHSYDIDLMFEHAMNTTPKLKK